MCDYSLQALKSRPAVVEDRLITKSWGTGTIGFFSEEDPDCAVCLLPGTEVAFEGNVKYAGYIKGGDFGFTTAIFRQVSKERPNVHHDTLEFPDGQTTLVTYLQTGQKARVLQLPAAPKNDAEKEEQRRAEFIG